VFVTHSIPVTVDAQRYLEQHLAVAQELVHRAEAAGVVVPAWQLAYCSRSGAPGQPWLEPDINHVLRNLAAEGVTDVCVAPIGFISDHMEVIFDLDTEAQATASAVGITLQRAATAGTHPAFVEGVVQLLLERAALARDETRPAARIALSCPPAQPVCALDCCANPRAQRPSLCGETA
jgi:ferrochelatase